MGVRTMKKSMMMAMVMCLVVAAGSASAEWPDVWLFNVDYGPNPGGSPPFEGDTLTVGPAIFGFGEDDYWNWRGGARDHQLLSDGTYTPEPEDEEQDTARFFGSGGPIDLSDEDMSPNPLLGTAFSPYNWGEDEFVESASYNANNFDDFIGETLWLVVYSGGDGTDKYKTDITVSGHATVTSSGTNSSEFIEGENYWVFEVVVNTNGQIPIEIARAEGAEYGLISGVQLTNAEPDTTEYTAPVLAFGNVITTLELSAFLEPTVTDNSDDITSVLFELESVPDEADPADVVLEDTTVDNQYPTAIMEVVTEGIYEVKLTLSDGQTDLEAIASVQFFADPCDAAKAAPDYVQNPLDFSDDCFVGLADLAIFVAQWLDNQEMKEQVTY